MGTHPLTIGTDGACLVNSVLVVGMSGRARQLPFSWTASRRTNNIAELNAVMHALRVTLRSPDLRSRLDSAFTPGCSTTWRAACQQNGMRNSKKEPVANADIILAIWEAPDARRTPRQRVRASRHTSGASASSAR